MRIYNNTLNPSLWNGMVLKPEVRQTLLQVAHDFYKEAELKAPIVDIYLLGSSANYNWTETSDIDLHVLIDFKSINNDIELVKKAVDGIKSGWNKNHNIYVKNNRIEVYIQDVSEKNRSLGIYSVLRNGWVKVPEKTKIEIDTALVKQKFSNLKMQIEQAVQLQDMEKMKLLSKSIYNMREAGLSSVGEYSVENIVFKFIRSKGLLDLLKNAIRKKYDDLVSVREHH